jgi:CheY-like chemotaxis protein
MSDSGETAMPATPHVRVVLHVDDDPNDAELLRAAALKSGVKYRLVTAEDGDEARAYLTRATSPAGSVDEPIPALVLLDLKMPRSTGLEVLRWIRAQPALGSVPVVVLSGSELQEDIKQATVAGANGYFVKPLGFEALVQLAREIEQRWLTP